MILKLKNSVARNKYFFIAFLLSLLTPFVYSVNFFSISEHYLFSAFDHLLSVFIMLSFTPLFSYFFTFLSPLFYVVMLFKITLFYLILKTFFKLNRYSKKKILYISLFIVVVSQLSFYFIAHAYYPNLQKAEILKTFEGEVVPLTIKHNTKIGSSVISLEDYLKENGTEYNIKYLIDINDDCNIGNGASGNSDYYWCTDRDSSDRGYFMIGEYWTFFIYFKENKVVKYSKDYFVPQVDPVLLQQ